MNIDRQALIDNLHRHIRNARAFKNRCIRSSFLESFHNVISVVPVYERMSLAKLDDYLLQNTDFVRISQQAVQYLFQYRLYRFR